MDTFVDPEDATRASHYALIASLLMGAPDARMLGLLSGMPSFSGEEDELPRAWDGVSRAARETRLDAVVDEFDAIFVGNGFGAMKPYAAAYLPGTLAHVPLAALRNDVAAFGLNRRHGAADLEDHLGAICEVMALVIGGPVAVRQSLATQAGFFASHLAPWYERCLDDIEAHATGTFYPSVVALARVFLGIERETFAVALST